MLFIIFLRYLYLIESEILSLVELGYLEKFRVLRKIFVKVVVMFFEVEFKDLILVFLRFGEVKFLIRVVKKERSVEVSLLRMFKISILGFFFFIFWEEVFVLFVVVFELIWKVFKCLLVFLFRRRVKLCRLRRLKLLFERTIDRNLRFIFYCERELFLIEIGFMYLTEGILIELLFFFFDILDIFVLVFLGFVLIFCFLFILVSKYKEICYRIFL